VSVPRNAGAGPAYVMSVAAKMEPPLPASLAAARVQLEQRFSVRLLETTEFRGELTYAVAPGDWIEVLRFCRETPALAFDQLDSLAGDHLPERAEAPLQVVAHLLSHTHGHRLRVKTTLAEGQALPTVTGLWPSAGFDEREAWEMFGIVFEGHPDLRRLLTTDDFVGHPLRKDFPLQGTVGGRIRTDLRGKI
jgi:NADH-quinone oxidoreductase subunit C